VTVDEIQAVHIMVPWNMAASRYSLSVR